jgi:hypothetical protein
MLVVVLAMSLIGGFGFLSQKKYISFFSFTKQKGKKSRKRSKQVK